MNLTAPAVMSKTQHLALAGVMLLTLIVLAIKATTEGWFSAREALNLPAEPLLLFFNRSKGCECELAVYQAADAQIQAWSPEERQRLQIIRIDLDRRRDLGRQFNLIRAPALLLIDENGEIIFGQTESVSDTAPLDLKAFSSKIKEISSHE